MPKIDWKKRTIQAALLLAVLIGCVGMPASMQPLPPASALSEARAADRDDEGARKAFLAAVEVLYHPRCMNCHPSGDTPLQKDDGNIHAFNVKRGPEGKGAGAMNCALCHRETNQSGGAPGVPSWHMPPESMPMVFQGRTPGELCRQLKDPKLNGGRTGEQIVEHISKDPLVGWAWNPGEGRTIPKMSRTEFSAKMNEWAKKGAACPE
jgi:hypothetical protein